MGYVVLAVRVLLGFVFCFFGLNYYLNFYEMPRPELPAAAANFASALSSGYMDAIKVFEVAGGLLLLTGLLVPLSLVLLMPVIVNIFFFDIFLLGKPGLSFALLPMAIFLIWAYWPYFMGLFTVRARPAVGAGGYTP